MVIKYVDILIDKWVVGILKLVVMIGNVVVIIVVFKIFIKSVFVIKRVVVNFLLNNFKGFNYVCDICNIMSNIYSGCGF